MRGYEERDWDVLKNSMKERWGTADNSPGAITLDHLAQFCQEVKNDGDFTQLSQYHSFVLKFEEIFLDLKKSGFVNNGEDVMGFFVEAFSEEEKKSLENEWITRVKNGEVIPLESGRPSLADLNTCAEFLIAAKGKQNEDEGQKKFGNEFSEDCSEFEVRSDSSEKLLDQNEAQNQDFVQE